MDGSWRVEIGGGGGWGEGEVRGEIVKLFFISVT